MVRPVKDRIVKFSPDVSYFKPRGIPMIDLEEVKLTIDEREAIRLADLLRLSHEEAGRKMGVSRATFGRIIKKARNTVAEAIINGMAINVEGGNYKIVGSERIFICLECNHKWEEPHGTGRPENCPSCKDNNIRRTGKND